MTTRVDLTPRSWQRITSAGLIGAMVTFKDDPAVRDPVMRSCFDGPARLLAEIEAGALSALPRVIESGELAVDLAVHLPDGWRPFSRIRDRDLDLDEGERAQLYLVAEMAGTVHAEIPDLPPDE